MDLYFSDLSKSYQGQNVFKNITGQINYKDKIGLVGANGVGKTTLARILAGEENSDKGQITYSPCNAKVLYIEQYPVFDINVSVYQQVLEMVSSNSNNDIKDIGAIVKRTLNKVGLDEQKWERKARSLSGGEKTKLSLCKAMVSDFDFLILDEPTNHLDMKSYEWLEDFVQNIAKPMMIISHDRYFLNNVVNNIWELTSRGLNTYQGNYSGYKIQKEIERKSVAKEYYNQQIKIQQLKQVINQRRNWYDSAHKAAGKNDFYRSKAKKHSNVLKAKQRELERIEKSKIDKPEKIVSPAFEVINKNIIVNKLPPFLVRGENLCKSFGEKKIFQDISFDIKRKDKIALIGQNGVGKTTFLKIVCGIDKNYSGSVTVNPSVKVGYFAQELDNLDSESTVLDSVLNERATAEETRLLLACLLFPGQEVYKKIGDLSMGEKGRVAFAKLILSDANLLVLDEPTNYMDIQSKEKVEEALGQFEGSILFVSHDRYLIQRLASRVFMIDDKSLHCYDGGYRYYLNKRKEQKKEEKIGTEYKYLADSIRRLEYELAFLGGKLSEVSDEEEKERLNKRYLEIAKRLNRNREKLSKL
ncbi:MAG: ABC-F type ribosomal protection protein [Clostridia bacterium]|nr:ABC-F type ribosomal protection protein [Clostridia bacterium]